MSEAAEYVIIDGLNDARSLVYSTWLRSYQQSGPAVKKVSRADFFAGHHRVLDGIFARNPTVKLAVFPEDHSVVFGWSVSEPGVLHYAYVKPDFRKFGIARALTAHLTKPFAYSHYTYVVRDLEKHLAGCSHNPYLVTP